MSAIIKACNISNSPNNTGLQCNAAMVATAMLIAMRSDITFTDADLADPVTWLTNLIHNKTAFPMFGTKAPIREIKNEKEADVMVTLDDGLKVFLRYGIYNRSYATTSGGLMYAKALQSFLNSGYNILEIDQQGQLLAAQVSDGVYAALTTGFMYSPSPDMADFKTTPYKNWFAYSYSPVDLVQNGIIFTGAGSLLSLNGLIDSKITKAAAATTTKLKIGVVTTGAGVDLVAKFPLLGTIPANFYVEDVAVPGTPVAISAAGVVSGHIELTGTFVSAHTYRVWGATPAVWLANTPPISGFDASQNFVDILIP